MSTSPTSAKSPDRLAALEAANKRARLAASEAAENQTGTDGQVSVPPEVRIQYLKIINDQILERNKREQAMDALHLIQQLLKGAHEGEEKKRKIRLSNAQIKRRLVDVKGATDYLLQCCWAPRTVNFEAHLVYPTNPNARQSEALAFGLRVLVDRLEVLEERWAKSQEAALLHQAEESARKDRAMTAFRDDRDKNSVKAEQERKIREARVAAGLPAYEHPNHKPSQNALTSYQDDEEDDEDPNPHGMLRMPGGGHVLGEEEAKPDASPS